MDHEQQTALPAARQLVGALHDLGETPAPPALLATVLARVGLGDAYWALDTAIGPVYVAYNAAGISAVLPAREPAAFEAAFRARFGRPAYPVATPPAALARAVTSQLRGEHGTAPPFDLRGVSLFERDVLLAALTIPRGEVRPYGWIAREIGRPGAVRAVGSALGRNPIPLLIPCHRVVKSDGQPGGYVFGPEAKRTALASEGVEPAALEDLARAGVRYLGSDTTQIYCFPTCRHARRITDRHCVSFRSPAAATAAGYRPCAACRPQLATA